MGSYELERIRNSIGCVEEELSERIRRLEKSRYAPEYCYEYWIADIEEAIAEVIERQNRLNRAFAREIRNLRGR